MTWFAVYEESTGALKSSGSSIADTLPSALTSKQFASKPDDNMVWDPATLDYVLAPEPPKRCTKIEFLDLFTGAEMDSIMSFQSTDMRVATFLEHFRAAEMIHFDDPLVAASLAYFETLGILEAGRAEEILSA